MRGQNPTAEARPLSENIAVSDIDQMLNDYVKPAFLKMSDENKQKAIELLKQMADA